MSLSSDSGLIILGLNYNGMRQILAGKKMLNIGSRTIKRVIKKKNWDELRIPLPHSWFIKGKLESSWIWWDQKALLESSMSSALCVWGACADSSALILKKFNNTFPAEHRYRGPKLSLMSKTEKKNFLELFQNCNNVNGVKSRNSHILLKQTQCMNCVFSMAKYLERRQQTFYLLETHKHSLLCRRQKVIYSVLRKLRSGKIEQ